MTAPTAQRRRRFTRSEYHQLVEVGVLHEDEPVELLAGEIYVKPREGESWGRRRRFTAGELRRMRDAGILRDGESTAHLEGEVREARRIGSRHVACVNRLNRLLTDRIGHRAIVSVQNPVALDDSSEPEPDLTVAVEREDFYASRDIRPEDILLAIEVADTTYPFDRRFKLPLYAKAGIVELWIVDLRHERVEVHRDPSGDGYEASEVRGRGGEIAPRRLSDVVLPVDEILP